MEVKLRAKTRADIAEQFLQYVDNEMSKGVRVTRDDPPHFGPVFHGMPGARQFRRHISENAYKPDINHRCFDDGITRPPHEET